MNKLQDLTIKEKKSIIKRVKLIKQTRKEQLIEFKKLTDAINENIKRADMVLANKLEIEQFVYETKILTEFIKELF